MKQVFEVTATFSCKVIAPNVGEAEDRVWEAISFDEDDYSDVWDLKIEGAINTKETHPEAVLVNNNLYSLSQIRNMSDVELKDFLERIYEEGSNDR